MIYLTGDTHGSFSRIQDMLELSDECYAIQNADEELKQIATDIIGSNDEDGAAKWLEHNLSL